MHHLTGNANNPRCESNAELGLGLICACLPAVNILTTHTQQHGPYFTMCARGRKKGAQSSSQIFDWPHPEGQQPTFSRSQLNSSARRGSTDSASLVASHENRDLSFSDNHDIIKMVSLNQHWENMPERCQSTLVISSFRTY
jgi:hypothetical protein